MRIANIMRRSFIMAIYTVLVAAAVFFVYVCCECVLCLRSIRT